MKLTLILGGVRAGKSARALSLANECAPNGDVLFVATAQAFDNEMEQRIAAHRAERSPLWVTIEEPTNISSAIASALKHLPQQPCAVVIDCLTLWTSNVLLSLDDSTNYEAAISNHVRELIAMMRAHSHFALNRPRQWFIVSNEVGLGIVPPTLLGRQYRDALGRANQLLAAAADRVTLMVAGLELTLK